MAGLGPTSETLDGSLFGTGITAWGWTDDAELGWTDSDIIGVFDDGLSGSIAATSDTDTGSLNPT